MRWRVGIPILALPISACEEAYQPDNEIPWAEVPALLATCEVSATSQYHDGWVIISMQDGTTYQSRTPRLDEIVYLTADAPDCAQDIPIIME